MNILYGILATSKQKKSIDAVVAGWVNDIKSPHRHIVIGDSNLCSQLPHVWNCIPSDQDHYKTLVNKMVSCYRQLLDDSTWDFFVKVDDDTFVVPERIEALLKEFDSQTDLYLGQALNCHLQRPDLYFASGGAGYVFTRSALKKAWPFLECFPEGAPEDVHIGQAMFKARVPLISSKLFSGFDEHVGAVILGAKATCHFVKPASQDSLYLLSKLLSKPPFTIVDYKLGRGRLGLAGSLGFGSQLASIDGQTQRNAISAHASSIIKVRAAPGKKVALKGTISDTGFGGCKFEIRSKTGNLIHDFGFVSRNQPSNTIIVEFPEDGILILRCLTVNNAGCHSIWLWANI